MSVAISWANKMQLAKCDIMVGFPIFSHNSLIINLLDIDSQPYFTSQVVLCYILTMPAIK